MAQVPFSVWNVFSAGCCDASFSTSMMVESVDDQSVLTVLLDDRGLRELQDVRRGATVERHVDERLVLAGRYLSDIHLDAGGVHERLEIRCEVVALAGRPLGLHRDRRAGEISGQGLVELGIAGRDGGHTRHSVLGNDADAAEL